MSLPGNSINQGAPAAWSGDERYNTAVMAAGEALWGLYASLIASATVLTLLMQKLGAGNSIGVIPAIEGTAALLPQVVGALLFHGKRPVKRILITYHLLGTIPTLVATAAVVHWSSVLPPWLVRTELLVGLGFTQAVIAIVAPSWTDWLARLFNVKHRGTVISCLLASSALVGVVGALFAGWLISLDDRPAAYARNYLLALFFALVSMAVFACVREREATEEDEEATLKGWDHCRDLLERFDVSIRDSNTRAFLVGRWLSMCGFSILPFIATHYTSADGGGLSSSFVVSCGAAQAVAGALLQVPLGRICDRRGHRVGLIFGVAMQVLTLVLVLTTAGRLSCMLAYFGVGAAIGSTALAHLNLLIETCPHDSRIAHITANNVILGLGTIIAPLLSGWIAGQYGTRTLFTICLAFSIAGVLWITSRMEEPRRAAAFKAQQASASV